ncbi:unnamed protein product [Gadus morhua 'NCC']
MVLPGIGCPSPRLPAVTTGLKSITVSGASSSPCCPEPEQDVHRTAQHGRRQETWRRKSCTRLASGSGIRQCSPGQEAEDQTPWNGHQDDQRLRTRPPGSGMGHQDGPEAETRPPGPGMGHQDGPEAVDQTPWTRNGAPGWTRG